LSIREGSGPGASFRYVDGDCCSRWRIEHVDIACEFCVGEVKRRTVCEVHVIIVNESFGHCDERNVAGEASIIEPVDSDGGNAVDEPGGVDGDDNEVRAGMQHCGYFAVEGLWSAIIAMIIPAT
jgi:hypothetical protein